MIFMDREGNYLLPDQVDEMSPWEIDERGIHVAEESVI